MARLIISLVLFSSLGSFALEQSEPWPHLRAHFAILGGFKEQPRTQAELDEQGWVKLSSCEDNVP